ncbi:GntR family transcriptional regulator [Neobacillus kokaensis]|uniref:GntR family transcriptional regulator n=1 Tax=Neobacillus kokaensis TaxID=2759023 RepID=A0ABQ3N3U6_9BACI|nr:GntR family transcriptional regulator [Neobacillus kokaensis]GHH98653.1 GntR family transcriptional regulator [Neobacillus kokaensis]
MVNELTKDDLETCIYRIIKQAIINRELAPGIKLPEEALASTLNVSRTPIRSALRRLSYEKLVQVIPRKGAFVARPSPKEVEDTFEMRMLLEDYSVRKACEVITSSEAFIQKIEWLIEQEFKAFQERDIASIFELIENIHIEIAKFSGNLMLINQLKELISLTTIYQTFYSHMRMDSSCSPKEHLAILRAIHSRDQETASRLMREHISTVLALLDFNLIKQPQGSVEGIVKKYYERLTNPV